MNNDQPYDIAITGGGLAGLAASIQLAGLGYSVILLEKEKYPFHKVCGEYISMESWDFLKQLGLPLNEMKLPFINTLQLTAPGGRSFTTPLPLGGFGISRFRLDKNLADIAIKKGVKLLEETRVNDISFNGNFQLRYSSRSLPENLLSSKVCCTAHGKRSNLDIKWKRKFLTGTDKRISNYVAVKYHIRTNWPDHTIGLHNFRNGYCGISKIEEDKYCLCYMTTADNLRQCGNRVEALEETILYRNPHLKKIFTSSEFLADFPVTISQISFSGKTQVEDHQLMLGDAAGMITPLCGNGMSMALHSAKLATGLVDEFLKETITRGEMEESYKNRWRKNFAARMNTGRVLQGFFGSEHLSDFFVRLFKTLPILARPVVKMTHGKPF